MFNPLKYFRNRKTGLALGSGGSKGVAHMAVIEYLEGMNIPIDMIAGASIGAVVGGLYAVGKLGQFRDDIQKKSRRDFYAMLDPVLPRSGLLEGRGIMKFLSRYIPRDTLIEDLPVRLAVVATDYNTGKSVVFRSGNLLDAIRASISIPGVFVPVRYRSTFLIDGGVSNPLPVDVLEKMGAGRTVAVNLHPQLAGGNGQPLSAAGSMLEQWDAVDSRDILNDERKESGEKDLKKKQGFLDSIGEWIRPAGNAGPAVKAPSIFEAIFQSVDIMSFVNTALMLKNHPPSVLIEPDLVKVETLDFSDVPGLLRGGREACERRHLALVRNVKLWI
jgi:NTE family protein